MLASTLLLVLPIISAASTAQINRARAVIAQHLPRQDVPSCLEACIAQQQANPGPCSSNDIPCLCADQQTQWNFAGCIQYTCPAEEAPGALAFGQSICSAGGAVPSISSAAISAASAASTSASGVSASISSAISGIPPVASSASSAIASGASAASSSLASATSAAESAASSIGSEVSAAASSAASAASSASNVISSNVASASNVLSSASASASQALSSLRSQTSAIAVSTSTAWAAPTAAAGIMGVVLAAAGAVVAI